jgi:hypothetical protein
MLLTKPQVSKSVSCDRHFAMIKYVSRMAAGETHDGDHKEAEVHAYANVRAYLSTYDTYDTRRPYDTRRLRCIRMRMSLPL